MSELTNSPQLAVKVPVNKPLPTACSLSEGAVVSIPTLPKLHTNKIVWTGIFAFINSKGL